MSEVSQTTTLSDYYSFCTKIENQVLFSIIVLRLYKECFVQESLLSLYRQMTVFITLVTALGSTT